MTDLLEKLFHPLFVPDPLGTCCCGSLLLHGLDVVVDWVYRFLPLFTVLSRYRSGFTCSGPTFWLLHGHRAHKLQLVGITVRVRSAEWWQHTCDQLWVCNSRTRLHDIDLIAPSILLEWLMQKDMSFYWTSLSHINYMRFTVLSHQQTSRQWRTSGESRGCRGSLALMNIAKRDIAKRARFHFRQFCFLGLLRV